MACSPTLFDYLRHIPTNCDQPNTANDSSCNCGLLQHYLDSDLRRGSRIVCKVLCYFFTLNILPPSGYKRGPSHTDMGDANSLIWDRDRGCPNLRLLIVPAHSTSVFPFCPELSRLHDCGYHLFSNSYTVQCQASIRSDVRFRDLRCPLHSGKRRP